MRKISKILAVVVLCAAVFMALAGCGRKDAGAVVKDLEQKVKGMDSYKGIGTMVIHGQGDDQQYQVEVWYQAPKYYRIALTNEQQDISQIILKNDEGVFVLTPHLNKSFRFQSDWPANQGQVYLYQSLVQSIVTDKNRKFAQDKNNLVFDVAGNYQSSSLVRQKIWLASKSYVPTKVDVLDSNNKTIVSMKFNEFQFGVKFDGDSFQMEHNMNASLQTLPTSAVPDQNKAAPANKGANQTNGASGKTAANGNASASGKTAANGNAASASSKTANANSSSAANGSSAANSSSAATGSTASNTSSATAGTSTSGNQAAGSKASKSNSASTSVTAKGGTAPASGQKGANRSPAAKTTATAENFGILEPAYLPQGMKGGPAVADFKMGGKDAIMLRYDGTYHYNLVEARPNDRTVWEEQGNIVQVGSRFGVLLGKTQHTLVWTYNGVEFRLSSGDLPVTEMVKVAASVEGQVGK